MNGKAAVDDGLNFPANHHIYKIWIWSNSTVYSLVDGALHLETVMWGWNWCGLERIEHVLQNLYFIYLIFFNYFY